MTSIISASLHGIVIAFSLIIPLGVQNIFIFNQGVIQPSFKKALPSVITASICDSILICLAVLGLSLVILQIIWLKLSILILGFIFLLYMGYHTWNQRPPDLTINAKALSAKKQILFAMSVSILNPHAIIDTIVVIGTSALQYSGAAKIAFTATCIIISWMWFCALAIFGRNIKKLDKKGAIFQVINKVAAIVIWLVAAYIAIQILQELIALSSAMSSSAN